MKKKMTEERKEKRKSKEKCYVLNAYMSPKFICWTLTKKMMISGDGTLGMRVRGDDEGGAFLLGWVSWWEETPQGLLTLFMCAEERPCEHIARRQLSTSHEVNHRQGLNQPVLWSWTSSLQSGEKMNVYCFSHPIYGILIWKPELTQRGRKEKTNKWMNT